MTENYFTSVFIQNELEWFRCGKIMICYAYYKHSNTLFVLLPLTSVDQ